MNLTLGHAFSMKEVNDCAYFLLGIILLNFTCHFHHSSKTNYFVDNKGTDVATSLLHHVHVPACASQLLTQVRSKPHLYLILYVYAFFLLV